MERLSCVYAVTRDPHLRNDLILYHQRLVRSLASRFQGGDEQFEDLVQVGMIGLINALDRFDPTQGTRFSTYATPTILGEIRRHFRDRTSIIKVPRWLQELHQAIRRATQTLTTQLGRPPTVHELSDYLDVPEEQVLVALEAQDAGTPLSLDTHLDSSTSHDSTSLLDLIGRYDRALARFEHFSDLHQALSTLAEREREVISLRFFEELSQAKIAQKLSISQMHVSRLQQRALRRLRDLLDDTPTLS